MPKRSLQSNQSGIILVWVTAAVLVITFMIAWYAVSPALFIFIDAMTGLSGSSPETLNILNTSINVIVWTALIFVGGILFWAMLSSFRRDPQEVPMG
jgi:hypothetical protein